MAEFIMQANRQQIVELKEAGYRELVRCKDCKYFSNKGFGCFKHTLVEPPVTNENWFCADGVRKIGAIFEHE